MGKSFRQPNPNKIKGQEFLKAKALEEGVFELSSGVLCKKLSGPGMEGRIPGKQCPKPSSIVYVNYTGKFIDGKVFDTTEGESLPALFVVRDLIMGWQIALTRMYEGDKWEIYIPFEMGYGTRRCDDIPAFSALVFELELVKIERL